MSSKIIFEDEQKTLEVEAGVSILEAALDFGINLDHDCGGNCACTTCCVWVKSGEDQLSAMKEDEQELLEIHEKFKPGYRLGCQSRVSEGAEIVLVKAPD